MLYHGAYCEALGIHRRSQLLRLFLLNVSTLTASGPLPHSVFQPHIRHVVSIISVHLSPIPNRQPQLPLSPVSAEVSASLGCINLAPSIWISSAPEDQSGLNHVRARTHAVPEGWFAILVYFTEHASWQQDLLRHWTEEGAELRGRWWRGFERVNLYAVPLV